MHKLTTHDLYHDDQGRVFKMVNAIKGGSQGKIYEIAYQDAQIRRQLLPYTRFVIKQELPLPHGGYGNVIKREIDALHSLSTIPHVAPLTGTAFDRTALIRPFYDDFKGELLIPMLNEIFDTITQIHQRGFIHGDVKIENIMVDSYLKRWVFVDFGSAQRIDQFTIDTFESTFVKQSDLQKQIPAEGAHNARFRPEIIDLYCFAIMVYRHLGGDDRRLPWRKMSLTQQLTRRVPYSPLPFQINIDNWEPECAHSKKEIKELFRQACIDEPPQQIESTQQPPTTAT